MQRFCRYINAVNGRNVSAKALQAAAAMVANAAAVEDGNDNLRVIIHVSGVSAGGDLGWASVYGQGPYVDPDVLRLFGQAHTFCRGRDVLTRNRFTADTPARLVGTLHRGGRRAAATPSNPAPLPASAEEEEQLEVFTSPADFALPPPLSIQRLARQVARAKSASRSSGSLNEGASDGEDEGGVARFSTGADGGAATGDMSNTTEAVSPLLPFVLECVSAPDPVAPLLSALAFMSSLFFHRRAPVQLLRATLKAVVIFSAMRFELAPRLIQEGFSRWWAHKIVPNQSDDGTVVAPRWPMGVKVPTRFLPAKFVKTAAKAGKVLPAERSLATGSDEAAVDQTQLAEEFVIVILESIPTSENHCKHEEAVAALLLLWSEEPRSRSVMKHEVFKADHAAMRRKAAPKRKSPGASSAAAVAASDGVAPSLSAHSGVVGASTVLATRAAARAAAGGAPPSATSVLSLGILPAPTGPAEGAGTVRAAESEEAEEEDEAEDPPVTPSPAKRGRNAQ